MVIISLVGTFPIEMMVEENLEAGSSESGAGHLDGLGYDWTIQKLSKNRYIYIYPIGSMVLVYIC